MKKKGERFREFILQILAINRRDETMRYIEISIEEAMRRCKKNAKVLVAEQDLEKEDCEVIFVSKIKKDYDKLFEDIQTAASLSDEWMEQLRLFTERQEIPNIKPKGVQKIVLIKE